MNLEEIDLLKLSKLTSRQIDRITCIECCKYYVAPETAPCGHTLCRNCWSGRKICPLCTLPVEKRQIKLNLPARKLTEHVRSLGEAYEKLFNVKLDEFLLDSGELEAENDPTKNVKDWLASSQNHFSAPAQSSDPPSQEIKQLPNPLEVSSSKIQVHEPTRKTISPEKVVHVSVPQDDWDKIETMSATEVENKNNENIIGPMDIEPFYIDDNEYSVQNPRRSSRKRELKNNNTNDISLLEKENPKDSSGEIDKKSTNAKQNWNNVKKMRKEFSKLNKINRNKLNVSIEMCKKTQSTAKNNVVINTNTPQAYEIDENTPKLTLNDLPNIDMTKAITANNHSDIDEVTTSKETAKDNLHDSKCNASDSPNQLSLIQSQSILDQTQYKSNSNQIKETTILNREPEKENQVRMPFYKKSALCTSEPLQSNQVEEETNPIKTINHNIESTASTNEDIEITIKVGSTITNIVIKKKNDVQLKVNTDREVQTSLCPQEGNIHSPQKIETRNVSINIGSNNEVNIEHKQITQQERNKQMISTITKQVSSLKSSSAKKNTASADTGTGQFEITESVEKELSNIMDVAEIEDQQKAKSVPTTSAKTQVPSKPISHPEKTSQRAGTPKHLSASEKTTERKNTPKSQKRVAKSQQMNTQEDLNYLNDLDIFESDTDKETNVLLLKYAKNTTPSEILISTAHNRNKTQKTEKRDRGDANDDLPTSKKQKFDDTRKNNKTTDLSKQSKQNQHDSESMNYDSIMGQVFATIDADMEEIKSQNSQKFPKNKNLIDKGILNDQTQNKTQNVCEVEKQVAVSGKYGIDCSALNSNDFCNQKESENIFSVIVEKEDAIDASAPKKVQEPPIEPQSNIEDFLTPVTRNPPSASIAIVESQVIEIVNDDSESVVEDTPQKDLSFGKLKQKSSGSTNLNSSQRINATESRVPSGKSTATDTNVVNLADTSGMKSANNVTVIETDKRKITLETPLTINKFVNHIQHNSTPVARKSLNFDCEIDDADIDPEQTLCPTSDAAKTTLEKEFMRKAFEKTPTSQMVKPLNRNLTRGNKRFCIAGSCLSSGEITKLRALCSHYKWSYVDKYTQDLTHLVVGVDEENKSQRSVKYMCALAASKWIVSSEWVEKCIETNSIVSEEKYEALDSTGEPGPRRSRVANRKLFQGITFYCMEPFSVLDVDTLKEMLETSGGIVVNEVKEVRVTDKSNVPAILLAEPENTQEDRFIYLAMELSIVPVNYEWVLNCLGSYTIGSVQELLLCPPSLLPKPTARWPQELIAREDD